MTAPYLLNPHDISFPPVDHALIEPNGLLAIGGDLSPERLLEAYRHGIFPWFNEDDPILWWSPNPRMILYPHKFKASKSLQKVMRGNRFVITHNQAFSQLLQLCASTHEKKTGTWITDDMQQAYNTSHKLGHAHSIEIWQNDSLVGGLYGLLVGKMFCGESMISIANNASKVALAYLVTMRETLGFELIDCQVPSEHLLSLGAETITREKFVDLLLND